MHIDVTIAIPVYNVAPYVQKCLESIFAQDVNKSVRVELLLIDDCSTDGSMEIVLEALRMAPSRFESRVIRHPSNLGLAEARNTAIREGRGEAIWFVDSDDYVNHDMLRLMHGEFDDETDIVISNAQTVNLSGLPVDIGVKKSSAASWSGREALRALYSREVYAFMWNKLIRRSLYVGVEFPPGKIYEDLAVMGFLFARARRVVHISESTYYYLIRDNAITSIYRPNIIELIENVNYGIQLAETIVPSLKGSPLVQNYIAREAWIPVMNSVAKAKAHPDVSHATVSRVRDEITPRALVLLMRARFFSTAVAAAAIWAMPRSYMRMYRYIISYSRGPGVRL